MPNSSRTDLIPPNNVEAERDLIKACLVEPSTLPLVASILPEGDFYRADHEDAYTAMLGLLRRNEPVDFANVFEELVRSGRYDHDSATRLLLDLDDAPGFSSNAEFYAKLVRDKATSRRIILAARGIIEDNFSHQFGVDELIARAQQAIFTIGKARQVDDLVTIREAMAEVVAHTDPSNGRRFGITTGLKALDQLVGFILPDHLIVIGARPSIGKSAIALTIAGHVAESTGAPVLFASLEMSPLEIGERFMAQKADLNTRKLTDPTTLNAGDRAALRVAQERYGHLPLFIQRSPRSSIADVAARSRAMKAEQGALAAIFIDYLQRVRPDPADARESRQVQVGKMAIDCRNLAMELQAPVFLLSQLNRVSEAGRDFKGGGKPQEPRDLTPQLHHLRESGDIEQEANMVYLLHRPEFHNPGDRPGEADLFVRKNRGGPLGTVRLNFDGSRTLFSDHKSASF